MAALAPPPAGVTREGVMHLDAKTLELWKESLTAIWTKESTLRRTWINLWTKTVGEVRGLEGKK
jgi:hypothetical protein